MRSLSGISGVKQALFDPSRCNDANKTLYSGLSM
jgi:hypothetical protein